MYMYYNYLSADLDLLLQRVRRCSSSTLFEAAAANVE